MVCICHSTGFVCVVNRIEWCEGYCCIHYHNDCDVRKSSSASFAHVCTQDVYLPESSEASELIRPRHVIVNELQQFMSSGGKHSWYNITDPCIYIYIHA